jgi:hypothetical protein
MRRACPGGSTGTSRAPLRRTRGGRCARARVPPVDYLDKPSHPSRRQRATDTERTNRENCQPCIRSIVSGMFPVAQAKMSDPANYLGLSEVMVDRVLAVTSQTIP